MISHGRSSGDVLKCIVGLPLLLPPFASQLTSHTVFFLVCSCHLALPDESPDAMEQFGHVLSSPKLESAWSFFSQRVKCLESLTLVMVVWPTYHLYCGRRGLLEYSMQSNIYESQVFRILIIAVNETKGKRAKKWFPQYWKHNQIRKHCFFNLEIIWCSVIPAFPIFYTLVPPLI